MSGEREKAVKELRDDPSEDRLWEVIGLFAGDSFQTAKGLEFSYVVKGGELFISRKEKSITKSTVDMAFRRARELDWVVTGPKKLGVFGASYLYPVFLSLGLITDGK